MCLLFLLFFVLICVHTFLRLLKSKNTSSICFYLEDQKKGHKKCFASFIESFVTSGFTSDVISDCARATYILKNVAIKLECYVFMKVLRYVRVFESIVIL